MNDKRLTAMIHRVMDAVHRATNVRPEDVVIALLSAAATYAVVHAGSNDGEAFGDTAQDLFETAYEAFGEPVERTTGKVSRLVH